ncbi:MAG: tetratricopeptide repeat-containing glycosyltransferase family protein [Magnetospirillum sp.]|nr:tetratricopeptide repeat-containing glycosyltransferase family protein [Magnetospirillum sp.]
MTDAQPILDAMTAGRLADADRLCRQGLAKGESALLRYLHGLLLHQWGRVGEALAALRHAAQLEPRHPDVRFALGVVLVEAGEAAAAAEQWRLVLEAKPDHDGACYNLARALTDLGELAEAAEQYRQLLAGHPSRMDARYNLANLHYRLGAFAEAAAGHRQVVAAQPGHAAAWVNLGMAELAQNDAVAAVAAYRRAIALDPGNVDGHWNLAVLLLGQRRWREGLAEFEWRLRLPDAPRPPWSLPRWTGAEPAGTRVLVWNDQGAGDALHFARYLRPLVARGYQPVVLAQDGLAGVLATVPGVAEAAGFSGPLPQADVHLPLLSLPHALGIDDPEADWPGPYVTPPAAQRQGTRRAVGLVWAGNPAHRNDARRSLDPALLAPLLACPEVDWVSLQVGAAAEACQYPPLAGLVRDLSGDLTDYSRTAAAIAGLDLVITVDTSVAHLAGAMGKPVWLMLPAFGLDWRWPRYGDRTPLYPSMHLFRQPVDGDWPAVVAVVAEALRSA